MTRFVCNRCIDWGIKIDLCIFCNDIKFNNNKMECIRFEQFFLKWYDLGDNCEWNITPI